MTTGQQHRLERRATLLAQRLTARVDLMAAMMRPDNRPAFHQTLSDQKALDFWRRHRYDEMGQAVISTWTPDQILSLDQRLSQANEAAQGGVEVPNATA